MYEIIKKAKKMYKYPHTIMLFFKENLSLIYVAFPK